MLKFRFYLSMFFICVLKIKFSYEDDIPGCTLEKTINGSDNKMDEILQAIRTRGLYGESYSAVTSDFTFKFKVCDTVDKDIPKGTIIRHGLDEGKKEVIGFRNNTSVVGDGEWTVMRFSGPNRTDVCPTGEASSVVMMTCDLQTKGIFSFMYEDKARCQFVFELRTSKMCNGSAPMSGWSIFFIILLVGFLTYLIIGVLYLRFRIGAKGVEQIPHREFWFRVGNSFADCFGFLCRCDKCFDTNSGDLGSPYSNYSPIVGGSTYPTTRDDAPLQP